MQVELNDQPVYLDGLIVECILCNLRARDLATVSSVCRALQLPAAAAAQRWFAACAAWGWESGRRARVLRGRTAGAPRHRRRRRAQIRAAGAAARLRVRRVRGA